LDYADDVKAREMHTWFWWENLKERNNLDGLGVDVGIILK